MATRLADLSTEQRKVLRAIQRGARRNKATPMELKAAIETGLVESGLRNPSGGDADSAGWRQERASLYPDPTNLDASVDRFFKEVRSQRGKQRNAGDLAAAVQRPAAQYRGRYAQHSADADALMGGRPSIGGMAPEELAEPRPPSALDTTAERLQAVQMLHQGRLNPLDFALQIKALDTVRPEAQTQSPDDDARAPRDAPTSTGGDGASAALSWAKSKLGFRESGENSGGLASYANARFGMSNQPWCAMFTSLAVTKGGAPNSARTASVAEVRRKAQAGRGYQKGYVRRAQAQPGDLILWGNRHIGMVESVAKDGTVTYVGGNQSDGVTRGTARDGDIVRPAYR